MGGRIVRGRRRAARLPRGRGGRRRCPRLRCLKEAEVGRTVLEEEELPSLVVAAVPGMELGLGRRNWPEEEEEEEEALLADVEVRREGCRSIDR